MKEVTEAGVATDVEVNLERKRKSHRLNQKKKRKRDSLMMITLRKSRTQICQKLKEELMKRYPSRMPRLLKSTRKRKSM